MLSSLAKYMEPLPDEEGDPFLTQIQALFQSEFVCKQQLSDQEEEGETLSAPSGLLDSNDFAWDQTQTAHYDHDSGKDHTQTAALETNENVVLRLGSVLSTEHDYLL